MSSAKLVVELFTEELPPKALKRLESAFAGDLVAALVKGGFVADGASYDAYSTPRRLAVSIPGVGSRSADQPFKQKLLPVSNVFCYGQVESPYGSGQFVKDLRQHLGEQRGLLTSEIADRESIIDSIRDFFGRKGDA